MWQPIFVKHPLAYPGRKFLPVLFDVVHGIMLKSRNQLEIFWIVSLESLDVSYPYATGQKRIFAPRCNPGNVAANIRKASARLPWPKVSAGPFRRCSRHNA